MTLRDYFATHAHERHCELSQCAAEAIVGRKMPEWKPYMDSNPEADIKYQLEKEQFRIDLNVALRLMWADAMLAARKQGEN